MTTYNYMSYKDIHKLTDMQAQLESMSDDTTQRMVIKISGSHVEFNMRVTYLNCFKAGPCSCEHSILQRNFETRDGFIEAVGRCIDTNVFRHILSEWYPGYSYIMLFSNTLDDDRIFDEECDTNSDNIAKLDGDPLWYIARHVKAMNDIVELEHEGDDDILCINRYLIITKNDTRQTI